MIGLEYDQVQSPMSIPASIQSHPQADADWRESLQYPIVYLLLIFIAEITTALFLYWGVLFHLFILVALLFHSVFVSQKKVSNLLVSMSIAPMIRILSLTTPMMEFSQISWFLVISIPIFITTFTVAHLEKLSITELFLSRPRWQELPLDISMIFIAIPVGFLEYSILKPNPMVEFNFQAMLAPSLILIVSTGFLEELIFRGLMQHNAEQLAGIPGIILISALFGVLHATNLVFWDVLLAGGAGFLFAMAVRRTGNIWGVSIAHGVVNINLFLIAPHLFA